jgi:hypothetical protein
MRVKVDYRQESRETYKRFKVENPQHKKLTYSQFQGIVKEFNYLIRDHLLETGDLVTLPKRLGTIYIGRSKGGLQQYTDKKGSTRTYQKRAVDWVSSAKYGKRIYFTNTHTDGYVYKLTWSRATASVKHSYVWRLVGQRLTNRLLAHYIFNTDARKNYRYETGKINN